MKTGAAERIRTSDPRITNALLYRLSYRGDRSLNVAGYPNCRWIATALVALSFSFGPPEGRFDNLRRRGGGIGEQMSIDAYVIAAVGAFRGPRTQYPGWTISADCGPAALSLLTDSRRPTLPQRLKDVAL